MFGMLALIAFNKKPTPSPDTRTMMIDLQASDGHRFQAYRATPPGQPRAGLVVLQEIFGVNTHIRALADQFAQRGYYAIAPALFDRVRSGIELGYEQVEAGRDVMLKLERENTIRDMAAAINAARAGGKVGAVGYCWGGALADLAACRCEIDAAVAYYGRHTATWLDLTPKCPVMYHFGGLDPLIPLETVHAIQDGRPDGTFFLYPEAGHGFSCDERHEYHAPSAELALRRTLEFFEEHLDGRTH
jgi:carboxymethylenebutenolidase